MNPGLLLERLDAAEKADVFAEISRALTGVPLTKRQQVTAEIRATTEEQVDKLSLEAMEQFARQALKQLG
ncbi:MAG: hypothetical protein KVP17_003776 [Porospora cf. gigantea B]|uniref:uncharacterized protein n=1 Tax=Porospora cf. gigantea B TaxID=2853592 RepID=UPI003571E554|nr:MAG: hypothetical protein KVP17_003776 [Porospora cf. gigantea B]